MNRGFQQGVPLFLALLAAGSSLADDDIQSLYTTPSGQTYALAVGSPIGVDCGPVPGGFVCRVNGQSVASVHDKRGCGLVRAGASCVLDEAAEAELYKGASTLECVGGVAYQLVAGPEASCDANNGLAMSCTSPDGSHYAEATCAAGCAETGGMGSCALAMPPRTQTLSSS